ncbi:hypothetical protein ABLE68_20600 [Nocardioides sp. CN2-186]|uniref:hypothetical protein n=1 Tax=Nocardioides tweenelious TaxID=3156607 RepID=UPI0032B399B6
MHPIPEELTSGPFTRARARSLGVSNRQLDGKRFVRVYPRVFRAAEHQMSDTDWANAARLALPPDAHLTGISRLQQLGLDYGPHFPIRFVVARDLHLAFDNVFLHRTKVLPPTDETGVSVAGAFISYCAHSRVIDAIKVGDWLLRRKHTTLDEIRTLALSGLWRHGADEAVWILEHLDGRARSLMESELRAILTFCGLPQLDVNVSVSIDEEVEVIGDLVYRPWRTIVEYEGGHHQEDRATYNADIDRYELLRSSGHHYIQVTKERIRQPRILVGQVYRTLLDRGYDGPPPAFGTQWELLFRSVSVAIGPRQDRDRRPAVG